MFGEISSEQDLVLPLESVPTPLGAVTIKASRRFTERAFYRFCAKNPELQAELDQHGNLLIIPPVNPDSGAHEATAQGYLKKPTSIVKMVPRKLLLLWRVFCRAKRYVQVWHWTYAYSKAKSELPGCPKYFFKKLSTAFGNTKTKRVSLRPTTARSGAVGSSSGS